MNGKVQNSLKNKRFPDLNEQNSMDDYDIST